MFVLFATLITAALALISTVVLFVCALIVTPFFFFSPAAPALLEKVTEIVVSPVRIAGSTITVLWSQLWGIAIGRKSGNESDNAISLTAAAAIRVAFTAVCLVAISIAPIHGFWLALAYILGIAGLIIVWTIFIVQSTNEPKEDILRIGMTVSLLTISAATLSALAEAPISGSWRIWSFVLAVLALLLISLAVVAFVWDDANPRSTQEPPPLYRRI